MAIRVDIDAIPAAPSVPRPRRSAALLQLIKFGAVGGVGVIVNFVVFNALWLTVFNPSRLPHGPILATIVATLVAIVVNWLGNRYWAFAAVRQRSTTREGLEFLIASLIGMGVPLLCIAVSRYVLGFHTLLADNIANNVVGLILGTFVRYVLYKFWVFAPGKRAVGTVPGESEASSAEQAEASQTASPA
jgi:putative flippase GtrA